MEHHCLSQITAGPHILTIQFMIFSYSIKESSFSKKKTKMVYPLDLDLSPYQPTHVVGQDRNGNQIMNRNTPLNYRLQAVTSHAGDGLDGGRYFAHVGSANRVRRQGMAYKTSDEDAPTQTWVISDLNEAS